MCPLEWHTEQRKINDLISWEKNPRRMTEKQSKDLRTSLEHLNLMSIPVIDMDNTIISGHQRMKIMQLLNRGEEIIDVRMPNRKLTQDEFEEANLRENKNLGEWDFDLLASFDVDMLKDVGWGDDELKEIFQVKETPGGGGNTDPDTVPDPPAEPKARVGDIYQLGRHRLMCGDSTKREDVERLMCGEKAEILFTSPPYFDQRTYGGDKDLSLEHIIQFIQCCKPFTTYQVINLGIIIRESEIIEYWQDYIKIAKSQGYKFLSWNVWDKLQAGHIGHQNRMFAIEHEWIFIFGEQEKRLNRTIEKQESSFDRVKRYKKDKDGRLIKLNRNKDGSIENTTVGEIYDKKNLGTVLRQYPELSREFTDKHPAIMRIEVPIEYINAMTDEKNIIIDPFGGSGTTLIACEKTNRRCFMMEIDPLYTDICVIRWINYMIKNGKQDKIIIKCNDKTIDYRELRQ